MLCRTTYIQASNDPDHFCGTYIRHELRDCVQLPLGFEIHFVCACFSNEVRGAQQALKCSGVSPPAFDLFPRHRVACDVSVVDVCDFELAATGRFQSSNDVVNLSIVHVNADDCVIRLRFRGLLVDANDATSIQSRHAETLRIGDLLQNDLRAATLRTISIDSREYVSLYYVVAENDANWTISREVLDEGKRFGDAAFTFLVRVVEMFQAKRFAVSEQAEEFAGGAASGHYHDVGDARIHESLNRVIDHRLVVNREQMFVCDRS